MTTSTHKPPSEPLGIVQAWMHTASAQRSMAQLVARTVADTLAAQIPGAAYLTLTIQEEDTPRDRELFPATVRDAAGQILFAFEDELPALGSEHVELRAQWGDLDPDDAFALRTLLRWLYIAGAVFDHFPTDLLGEDDDAEEDMLCLPLSQQARPERAHVEGEDHWGVETRRLRPYPTEQHQATSGVGAVQ